MSFDKILTKSDQILMKYVKIDQIHVKKSRDVIFSENKAPAGMPTHRTGVDNIKKPLKLFEINSQQLKSIITQLE